MAVKQSQNIYGMLNYYFCYTTKCFCLIPYWKMAQCHFADLWNTDTSCVLNIITYKRITKSEDGELSWQQLICHWQHRRLSFDNLRYHRIRWKWHQNNSEKRFIIRVFVHKYTHFIVGKIYFAASMCRSDSKGDKITNDFNVCKLFRNT